MAKVSLGKICGKPFQDALLKLMEMEDVPTAASLALRRVAKKIAQEVVHFQDEQAKIVKLYCEHDGDAPKLTASPDGKQQSYVFKDGLKAKYVTAYNALVREEIDLPTLSPDGFGAALAKLTPADLFQLEFIDEEEARPKLKSSK